MTFFILTDSDWSWDSDEAPPIIVEADDEQEAARLACEKMIAAGDDFDGAHLKLSRLATHAFVGVERERPGDKLTIDPTQFIHEAPKGAFYRTTIWARPLGSKDAWQWAADTGGTVQNVADCLLMCSRMWDGHEFAMTPFLAAQRVNVRAVEAKRPTKAGEP